MIVPAYRQASTIAILSIEGPIDHVTLRSLERRVEEAKRRGASAIVLRLNTPGGEMTATLEICRLVKNDMPANSVAWVDPAAYSAGTFIALACREIVMSPNARMGDAAPIAIGPTGIQSLGATERAKTESPLLAEIVDSARRRHVDENLVKSFVTLSPGLWLLEDSVTGERIVVDPVEFRAAMGVDAPASAQPAARSAGASRPPTPWISRVFDQSSKSRRGSKSAPARPPTAEEIAVEIELAQSLPPVRSTVVNAEPGRWRLVHQVIPPGQLLTLTTEEAEFYGISSATIADEGELRAWFGATKVIVLDEIWSETLVRVLVSPWVRGVLLIFFIVCLFIELSIPGFGVFGTTAMVALLLLIGAPMLAGLAQWWEIVLIIAGLALIAAEVFVIPGFGVAGISGAACLLVGLVGTFVAAGAGGAESRDDILRGVATMASSMIFSAVAIWFISRKLESLPFMRRFTLHASIPSPLAVGAGPIDSDPPTSLSSASRALQPGEVGVAATDLRPSGRGQFSGRLVDVSSHGEWVSRGAPIRVVAVGRFEVEVEEAR